MFQASYKLLEVEMKRLQISSQTLFSLVGGEKFGEKGEECNHNSSVKLSMASWCEVSG